MNVKCRSLLAVLFMLLSECMAWGQPYRDASLPIERRVENLLVQMTAEEKVGQLLCPMGWTYRPEEDTLGVGMLWATFRADPWTGRSLENGLRPQDAAKLANELQRHAIEGTRLGIPLLLAEETPHGHMAIGTTTFPTGLGLGATFSTALMERMGQVIATELRQQGAHIGFGPVLDIARDPRWSRTEETMGEDAVLTAKLGAAIVRGMTEMGGVATLKHLAAYGMGQGGQNGAGVTMGKRELLQTYLPPFHEAIAAGAMGVMTAYNAIDGVPCTANAWLLTDVLRRQWGFQGLVISDLFSINVLHNTLHVARSLDEAARLALRSGADVDLGASGFSTLNIKNEASRTLSAALDEAVRRVLRLKFELGLFDNPYVDETAGKVHCPEHTALAKEIACAAITLLKNDGTLPLSLAKRIAIVGPNADNVYAQLGDYTAPQEAGKVITLKNGLLQKGYRLTTIEEADAIVAVVGGSSSRYQDHVEYQGTGAATTAFPHAPTLPVAESGEGLDRCSLDLLGNQQEMLVELKRTGKPLVVVYIEGRPLLKNWAAREANALLTAYYPGEQGGTALADVLCGDYNPAGRLPISVPRNIGQLPVNYNRPWPLTHDYVEDEARPLYPFGYGLSYTTFEYSGLVIEGRDVSFTITNTGPRDGEEVPQLYLRDEVARTVQAERQLRCFERVFVPKGQARRVTFRLEDMDLAIVDDNLQEVVEPGRFTVMVGSSSQDIRLTGTLEITAPETRGDIVEQGNNYQWPEDEQVVANLRQWQDQKFGVLMHWGLYSVPGIVESWSICDEDWIRRDTTMTYDQYKRWYWGLAERFKPSQFNPSQWARIMKDAGMKYMLFTTKHHDGFCLFRTRQTDFNVAHYTGGDLLAPILEAFRQQGFMTGTYFSKPDWHTQTYWWDVFPTKGRNVNYPIQKYPHRWEQFKQFTYNQLEEIMSGYGKIDILWLDGGWVCKENRQDIDMPSIAQMARRHQPGLIIVDRTIHGPYENYQTPERTIPETQLSYPWESCIPLSDDWGWVPQPRWKSPRTIINTLIEVVAKGGNLVLGVGPTAEGTIQSEVEERLQVIGQWLQKNGRAIYATVPTANYRQGPFWFTASKDGKTCYAILALPEGEELPEAISWEGNIPRKGSTMRLLSTGKKLHWTEHGNTVHVTLPKGLPNEPIAIEFTLQ